MSDKKINIVTPQFERPPHWPKPKGPPRGEKGWQLLRTCTAAMLIEAGYVNWDGKLFLFPAEWYDHIPDGYEIVYITGKTGKFEKGVTDNDIRIGCLAYGINAIDGVKR